MYIYIQGYICIKPIAYIVIFGYNVSITVFTKSTNKSTVALNEKGVAIMNPIHRSLRAIMLLFGSYAVLTFLYVLPVDNVMMQHRTTSVFYFLFATSIALYFAVRIIEPRVRKNLIGVGVMIILWCILRAAKDVAHYKLSIDEFYPKTN